MNSNSVRRIFVEKRPGYDVEAQGLLNDLRDNLGLKKLKELRSIHRYDVQGITDGEYEDSQHLIFSEPPVDFVYDEWFNVPEGSRAFAMEYLPGQYDQRADSAAQCIQMLTQKERPQISSAKVIVVAGEMSDAEFKRIKDYCINPVEAREALLDKPESLDMETIPPADVAVLEGFAGWTETTLESFRGEYGLAMSEEDLRFCQTYFRDTEHRDPTLTEIRVIDTYWSDHCRHTTFLTKIEGINIDVGDFSESMHKAYEEYLATRESVYGARVKERAVTLMDLATLGMKALKQQGLLADLDESDEINACSIVVEAEVDERPEEWLVMFKNETHNHPTEIEPFGGAATCLGGAIRDPLSGRTYVYQAMRVTGSGDPRVPLEKTLPGKLPQRKITTGAASGYSSYGNQIGLATGQVAEVYDEGFIAKRMEVGAVIAAAPRGNVRRQRPEAGDVVLLVGGRTGRDGCGGATGSSKEHTEESLFTCGSEVQKGNPPTERKIQRLFRNPEVSRMIKRCNDFGAGGVSVAIGELTEGLDIWLDRVPKKYEGLDGTELAISESQERMAVVVAPEHVEAFVAHALEENLEATQVAEAKETNRLRMLWRDKAIVDISRDFLNTNGIQQRAEVKVRLPQRELDYFHGLPIEVKKAGRPLHVADVLDGEVLIQAWLANLGDLNVCSQKGLVERFDSSIGAGTILMPFGGRHQATPAEGMAAKLPVLHGETNTATLMTYGYNPQLAMWSPFHGAIYAVVEAVAKVVALGGDYRRIRLTLQEYFEKLGKDPEKWGKPFSALLGAFYAQKELGIPAIGGKDSMSGTFKDLHVPPTLVAFAVAPVKAKEVISQEFKAAGSQIVLIPMKRDADEMPDFAGLKRNFAAVYELMRLGAVRAAYTIRVGGLAAALSKMAFGNRIGAVLEGSWNAERLFGPAYGSLLLEIREDVELSAALADMEYIRVGRTQQEAFVRVNGVDISLAEAWRAWSEPLEKVFPTRVEGIKEPQDIRYQKRNSRRPVLKIAKPRVLIPVFPGTNCEYDSARAFEKAGALVDTLVIRNLTPSDVEASIKILAERVRQSQIVMLVGGFSAGDEPDGSGKFIATMLRNPRIKDAVLELLKTRDGLMLGICNGFQALIKLGLVPFGEIREMTEESPTLTYNTLGRHVSCMAQTKVSSVLSPWFSKMELGEVHTVALSHGEGRFVAPEQVIQTLIQNGQVATQYVDLEGKPSGNVGHTPNGSFEAIEGITSPDGRILGKMGHSERTGSCVAINIPGNKYQPIFEGGVGYFR
ncbi:MAG: phosphoribosylformylglycinamidine synthase [Desulfitobacteriaceae bacterium]|nr:phosphoribosylformylglycinamidine synthase [Desulfitobacteriaceae bacterium]MDI6912835.1 phosphoribosylformylglycinamidine synthase [Desulfitobacteriaceae bacterium]